MPAPRSKPSRTTYIAIMTATRQNQVVCMSEPRPRGGGRFQYALRAFVDCAIDQEQEENREDGVDAHETDQGEEGIAGGDVRGDAGRCAHDAVDQPRLAAHFGGDPSGGGRDVRKRDRKSTSLNSSHLGISY